MISFSFADVKGRDFTTAREAVCQVILDLYAQFDFLLEDEKLGKAEREYFSMVTPEMSDTAAAMTVKRLSMCLSRFYGKKVLIFLDEYDTPLQEAYMYGYWDDIRKWYDGFAFGGKRDIYNPWSITCFLKEGKLNTSSNQLVGKLIREGSAEIKMVMEGLLTGNDFWTEIDEEIVFDQL